MANKNKLFTKLCGNFNNISGWIQKNIKQSENFLYIHFFIYTSFSSRYCPTDRHIMLCQFIGREFAFWCFEKGLIYFPSITYKVLFTYYWTIEVWHKHHFVNILMVVPIILTRNASFHKFKHRMHHESYNWWQHIVHACILRHYIMITVLCTKSIMTQGPCIVKEGWTV